MIIIPSHLSLFQWIGLFATCWLCVRAASDIYVTSSSTHCSTCRFTDGISIWYGLIYVVSSRIYRNISPSFQHGCVYVRRAGQFQKDTSGKQFEYLAHLEQPVSALVLFPFLTCPNVLLGSELAHHLSRRDSFQPKEEESH